MRGCLVGLMACVFVSAQASRSLYQTHCAACHGPTGEGRRGPALRVAALQRANDVESLAELLRRGIPGTEMSAVPPQVIADEALRGLARYVLSLRANSGASFSSNIGRGSELFRGKGKCLDCHRVAGEGSASGPDLSDIGRLRDPQWLRRSILEPEEAVFDSFVNYRWTILITGKPVWHYGTGGPIFANPVSFMVNGRQHVAIAAGNALFAFVLPDAPQ